MEDFLYFLLIGQSLPGTWSWMSNFVINLEDLFGYIPTDINLLIFCIIIVLVTIFIPFDSYGYV